MSLPMNPGDVESYADRVARQVPGLRDMHRMCGLLLTERVPSGGGCWCSVLVADWS